jgi:hypothetical protein
MIRDVVIHLQNEQPLLADLYQAPVSTDVALVCTNLRMLNGKRPIFVDDSGSSFIFPFHFIRFVEIPPGSRGDVPADADRLLGLPEPRDASGGEAGASAVEPETALSPETESEPEREPELEIDEDFLRRVRDV